MEPADSATYGTTTVHINTTALVGEPNASCGRRDRARLYAGQQIIQVYTYSGGNFQGGQQYIWSPLYVDTPILRDSYDANGNLSRATIYYHTDANHNVTAVTDSSGVVVERYAYDAYGNVTVYNADWTLKSGQLRSSKTPAFLPAWTSTL